MFKCISMLLKPRLNSFGCVYEPIVILKNCIIVRKQHVNHRMPQVTLNVHVITGRNSTIHSNYRTSSTPKYCCPNRRRSFSIFHSWNLAFRIIGFIGCSPNINRTWCWEQREGRLIWPYYVFPIISSPGFMIITPSFGPFSVVFSNQMFSNRSCPLDVGFVTLSSDFFCGNRVFKMNNEFCCHLCCGTMIVKQNPLQCAAIPFT